MKPLTVPGQLDSLGAIAQYVMEAAKEAGLDKKKAYQLRLGVDEIATNIILYGYEESGLEGDITCYADIEKDKLTIILEDTAIAFDPTKRPDPKNLDAPLEERQIGGLGVFLAMEGTDEFLYERVENRNRNIFIVYR